MKLNTIIQALKLLEGYGNKKVFQLISKLELLSKNELSEIEFIEKIKNYNLTTTSNPIDIENVRNKLNLSSRIDEQNEQNEIASISIFDKEYPNQLRDLASPPLLLYYRGNKQCLIGEPGIAIIGSRKASELSLDFAFKSALGIGKKGITVVSGLALGCDTAAHKGTLAGNGKTVAVLAGGIDNDTIYPKGNLQLAHNIIEKQGCLVSEYPSGTPVAPYTFIERDRIQSGLSHTLLVIQTTIDGGSMQTYKFAVDQKRRVACFNTEGVEADYSGNAKILENINTIPINIEKDLEKILTHQPNSLF